MSTTKNRSMPGQPRTTHRVALVELLELVDALAVVSCGRREVADLKCSVSLRFYCVHVLVMRPKRSSRVSPW